MSDERLEKIDELSLELRRQRAIYRIAKSDDGVHLADRLNEMLDEYMGEMIAEEDPIKTEIAKGKCRGLAAVIAIFAEIEEQVIATEELIEIERSDEEI